jgi:hypothetical protein
MMMMNYLGIHDPRLPPRSIMVRHSGHGPSLGPARDISPPASRDFTPGSRNYKKETNTGKNRAKKQPNNAPKKKKSPAAPLTNHAARTLIASRSPPRAHTSASSPFLWPFSSTAPGAGARDRVSTFCILAPGL